VIKPEPQVLKGLALAVRQHPEVLTWLKGALEHEIRRLPWAIENAAVFQGRCQVLSELVEFAEQAPALAAKY
jgi:hypothetical protein